MSQFSKRSLFRREVTLTPTTPHLVQTSTEPSPIRQQHSAMSKSPYSTYNESIASGQRAEKSKVQAQSLGLPPTSHQQEQQLSESTLVDEILVYAFEKQASDIHFEPYETRYRIRLRIDGMLRTYPYTSTINASRIAARLKILAQLDIAEKRLPQDGQFKREYQQQRFSLRLSTLPIASGEKIVLRIIRSAQHFLALEELGLTLPQTALLRQALNAPQGLILVTGPTGSGKTVTLYSGLNYLNQGERNLCTVEDPIEVPLNGINQAQIVPKAGLGFSEILRAFLRQDPDVIMVGEIRDSETAATAIQAAQTGHLVLSTLHTNSALETLERLVQMGIPAYQLTACLRLIVAQRLVRRLCEHCKQQKRSDVMLERADGSLFSSRPFRAVGCKKCDEGYRGRIGVFELLAITEPLKALLLSQQESVTLKKMVYTQATGMLYEQALECVTQGVTSVEELYRVFGEQ